MESTRPIRSLMRGLDALTVLNLRDGATVSEVVQEVRLPRTTVYRILETLVRRRLRAARCSDDRYRLTIMVRGLSDGFDDEAWVTQIAKPFIYELCAKSSGRSRSRLCRERRCWCAKPRTTAARVAVERYSAGFRVPLLTSATGLAYLAHCPATQRDTLIEVLARSGKRRKMHSPARAPNSTRCCGRSARRAMRRQSQPARIRRHHDQRAGGARRSRVLAGLTVRFAAAALSLPAALTRFLPKLRDARTGFAANFPNNRPKGAARARPTVA
jgi:IclR family transcriptional regulator, mhp operon transcriptional activator